MLIREEGSSGFYTFVEFIIGFIILIAGLNYIWGRKSLVWLPSSVWQLIISLGIFLAIIIGMVMVWKRM